MTKKNFQLSNAHSLEIDIDCRYNEPNQKLPLIIFCHGFKGFKDWGGFPYMMERFAGAGFFAVSFNFSCCGVVKEAPMDFTRLDLFAENTLSGELEDLQIVTNHFYNNADNYMIDKERISLAGHSRGGGAVILHAASDKRISKLVTLAAVSTYDRYGKETKRIWKEKGFIEAENTRTKQMMRMNLTLLEDFEKNSEKLDIKKAASNLKIPYLIIHGKEDISVKCSEAEEIYALSDKSKAVIEIIENTGHTFGVVHPYAGITPQFELVIEKAIEFLLK